MLILVNGADSGSEVGIYVISDAGNDVSGFGSSDLGSDVQSLARSFRVNL
jgi:hypothetical protein